MDVRIYGALLLVLRFIATVFITGVLWEQARLMRLHVPKDVGILRKLLLSLGVVLLLMQIIPIIVDVLTIVNNPFGRDPQPWGVSYAFSNAIFAAVASILVWIIYRVIKLQNSRLKDGQEESKL
jgi:hypothetical protein